MHFDWLGSTTIRIWIQIGMLSPIELCAFNKSSFPVRKQLFVVSSWGASCSQDFTFKHFLQMLEHAFAFAFIFICTYIAFLYFFICQKVFLYLFWKDLIGMPSARASLRHSPNKRCLMEHGNTRVSQHKGEEELPFGIKNNSVILKIWNNKLWNMKY